MEKNAFSLLVDEEDEVSTLVERLAKEAKAKEQQKQKRIINTHYVKAENGKGTGGQGRGSSKSDRSNGQQFGNGYGNGYQLDNRRSNGYYQQNNGGTNGYQSYNGSVDGHKRNNGWGNGYQQNYKRGDGGYNGSGRDQVKAPNGQHNGAEKKSQIVVGDKQVENKEQGGETGGGWQKVMTKQHKKEDSIYGGGRGQNGRGGRNNGNGYWGNNSGAKGTRGGSANASANGDNDNGNVAAATQVSKQDAEDNSGKKVEDEQVKEAGETVQEETEEERRIRMEEDKEWEARRKAWLEKEARRQAWLEDAKKLTLKQYEEQLLEKRRDLEKQKSEERKVTLDKDLKSMQLVGKKKEDFINQDSENGKLKKKDDKIRKSVSYGEFMKPAQVENHAHGGSQGRGGGGSQQGGGFQGRGRGGTMSGQATDRANGDRFPQRVEGREGAANFDKRGGGGRGGSTRGSSADPAVTVAPIKVLVKPHVPAFNVGDSKQFPVLPSCPRPSPQPL